MPFLVLQYSSNAPIIGASTYRLGVLKRENLPFFPRVRKKPNAIKMPGVYVKRGRVTWLARNTTEFARSIAGPRFFSGHVFYHPP